MEVELDGQIINVTITRKNNKNMYLRVKPDGIHISCNYLTPKRMILNFILANEIIILLSSKTEVILNIDADHLDYFKTFYNINPLTRYPI